MDCLVIHENIHIVHGVSNHAMIFSDKQNDSLHNFFRNKNLARYFVLADFLHADVSHAINVLVLHRTASREASQGCWSCSEFSVLLLH